MLCPEVWDFPPPKVMVTHRENQDLESVNKTVNMNNYYKSLVVTCPDEIQAPGFIQDLITEDTDYYKLSGCSLTEFVEPVFIESFVKTGKVYCLSVDRNCIIENCAAITPDGHLVLHIVDYVYQTLGFEGTKRPHNFYEVKIDLKTIKNYSKVRTGLQKLEQFDLNITWEPNNENICPSSIAKYFSDRGVNVSVHSLKTKSILPTVTEIPVVKDVDADEMVEWIGLLALGVDITPTDSYISSYSQPESENALRTGRISILTAKGFITPPLLSNICKRLSEFVQARETENYWASISIQSDENCLWQWNPSSQAMFQAHSSSSTVFFTHDGHVLYSVGHLKYS
ncbi:ribonuclease P protein subunit p40 [Helicoverpa armigera]|uniref:ribonuclease P protein subunit p40 n=1 Tax=Helicoverpa armigera TaxID=29058 RepID=UPI00308285FA